MAENDDIYPRENEGKSRILVADDSRLVRVTAQKILAEKFDLILAKDGEEAWDHICKDNTIQVVFTDLGMPKVDGYSLIQRVRKSEDEGIRNLPIIVLTGATEDEEVRKKAFNTGATDFLTKPFNPTSIIARADAHVSHRRTNTELQKSANIDSLTGILNRNGFNDQLKKDISFINRHAENLSLMILELDDFNAAYDRIGKKISEQIITHVAKMLAGAIRQEDSIGRDSLAKFMISLPTAKPDGVVQLAKRLSKRVESLKIKVGEKEISITLSAGISTVGKGGPAEANDIIRCAEQALHNAKQRGPGEVQLLQFESGEVAKTGEAISIDNILERIRQGDNEQVLMQMDAVLNCLAPLIELMSEEQKKQLLKNHQ